MTHTTFHSSLATIGARIISRPNSRGESLTGIIFNLTDEHIQVDYAGYGNCTLNRNGRLMGNNLKIETNLDIILIIK